MTTDNVDKRIILLIGSLTYRADPFVQAAEHLGLEVVKGLDMPKPLARFWHAMLPLDFRSPDRATRDLVAYARAHPVHTIMAVDDAATIIAARACAELGISHNAPEASYAARNKYVMRRRLIEAGLPGPNIRLYHTDDDPRRFAHEIRYPCVVKPLLLSGSQGVIRADDPEGFVHAFNRTRAIVLVTGGEPDEEHKGHVLVEDYMPGVEVVLEGILAAGRLMVLALFDKPDPLVGPFFEETIYVTPSRLPRTTQDAIIAAATAACAALGLREGPVHAELRIGKEGPRIVEVAGRSIGGLCSKILRFGTEHSSLEELILRRAMDLEVASLERERRAGGVMMIPIPGAGILKRVEGVEDAQAVAGVEEIDITIPLNHPLVPLPEGASYLGFIFARGERPDEVEEMLREAHRRLRFVVVPQIVLRRSG